MAPNPLPGLAGPGAAPSWLARAGAVAFPLLVLLALGWVLTGLAARMTLLVVAALVALLIAGVFVRVVE